jgi:GNAT superfamily N-acetyltransferase
VVSTSGHIHVRTVGDEPQLAGGLADVLVDCVDGGASVSFMWPLPRRKALDFWGRVIESAKRGERTLLVAEDTAGEVQGTVQVVFDLPENQPHRCDIAKMLVHRRARCRGVGTALMVAAESAARAAGRTASAFIHAWAGNGPESSPVMRCGLAAVGATRHSFTRLSRSAETRLEW